MDPGGISVERTLPIDGALLDNVLLQLRRDCAASVMRWTLGDRGTAEVDVCFTSAGPQWSASARLWSEGVAAVAAATLRLEATAADEVLLTLEPVVPLGAGWGNRVPELIDLAHAAVDELGEELLWHATRAGFTARG